MARFRILAFVASALVATACIPDDAPKPSTDAVKSPADGGAESETDSKALLATVEKMKAELKNRPRSFNIDAALASLYYDNGKYIDAIQYYTEALNLSTDAEAELRKLLAADAFDPHAVTPDACRFDRPDAKEIAQGEHERLFEVVVSQAHHQDSVKATNACLAQLVPLLSTIYARRGNCWYLIGNVDKARADHSAALSLDPNNAEALFFSGALALETAKGEPAKLEVGKAFWRKLLKVAPDHPRAQIVKETLPRVDELFGQHPEGLPAGHPQIAQGDGAAQPANNASAPMLPPGMMEAMQNTKHTPEMDAQLDKTTEEGEALLQKSDWQGALDKFKQVMPLRPDGRIALDLGIAERELGKPMAERVLMNATRMPGGDPQRAKYELAIYYEKHDVQQAKTLYQELLGDPKVGANAKARLAGLP